MEFALSMKAAAASSPSSSSSLFSRNLNPMPTHLTLGSFRRKFSVSPCFRSYECVHSPSLDHGMLSLLKPTSPDPNTSPFSCSALASSSSETIGLVLHKLQRLVTEFQSITEPVDRVKWVLHHASLIPTMPESSRTEANRVMGCTARVWLDAELGQDGKMRFWADSDSDITRGLCSCLIQAVDSALPEEVLALTTEDLVALNVGLLGTGERSRVNTWHNVLVSMQKRTRRLVAEREGHALAFEPFPSLVVTADGIEAKGSYAEAQVSSFLCNLDFRIVIINDDDLENDE